jgi:hypothetical protein
MCEIALCVRDMGTSGDIAKDCKLPQRGDVIEVLPDGWPWAVGDLGQSFFRIIKLPNVTVAQASNMRTPEIDADPQNPSPYLQYRARYLDRTKINPVTAKVLLDYWDDDARAAGFLTLPYSAAQINNIVSVRAPIQF